MKVQPFFHRQTGTLTYIVSQSQQAIVIDPVLDYVDGKISHDSLKKVVDELKSQDLELQYILETHIHADHLSGAQALQQYAGGKTAISTKIADVYDTWVETVNGKPLASFDILLNDGDTLPFSDISVNVLATPGHTPADLTYHIDDSIFVGDTLFAPHRGTARADFPGGSANDLYRSISRLYGLPDNTKVYLCHDYPSDDEEPDVYSTLAEQKSENVMLSGKVSEEEYVAARLERDNKLAIPKLLDVAIPFNLTYALP
ncbi:MBL fold metallo-hydrolase [Veronia pacifica]|uniref:MBL fold metallo-hydrolase n=1 Tax=Veronia pacifica TaxID=1080227 RepID=A0A1C3EM90_9GAMM|nr:MBL fold metallo-hydrolase [Veronia pacifica]ODA34339.1 MBL fold metallo-hydrolase [Veronia pacifica]